MSGEMFPDALLSEWPSVAELGRGLDEGRWTSRDLLRVCRERVERLDGLFSSVRCLSDDATGAAADSDRRLAAGRRRSPLDGIPVLVKDNIDVSGLPTTAGALGLADARPASDAHLVARLRQAGAVIAGKTNLSELANFLTEDMPSGYSSLGGQVLNPYDLALTPSGSSSGSASAVALGLAPLAVGTETDGSITSPSAHQSLVGLKPTVGLVSRHGIVPIAPSQDTAGPMVRTVADAAALLAAMAGPHPADPDTVPAGELADRLRGFDPDPGRLGSARVVAVRSTPAEQGGAGEGADIKASFDAAVRAVAGGAGAFTEWCPPEESGSWSGAGLGFGEAGFGEVDELFVLHYEFAPAVDRYLEGLGPDAPARTLRQLRDWNRAHAGTALKYRQVHVDIAVEMDHDRLRDEYLQVRARDRDRARDHLEAALGRADADVVMFADVDGATWAARAGWPCVALPAGYRSRSRRPFAVTLVSRPWTDALLLSVAAGVERVLAARRPPWEVNPAPFRRFGS